MANSQYQPHTAEEKLKYPLDYHLLLETYIDEINAKFAEAKENVCLKLINTTQDMLDFAKNHHQSYRQIGFLVKTPQYLKNASDQHISPVLFDSATKMFVQLDSVMRIYLLPQNRKFYYSPFHRQAANVGCGEDAVLLLQEIMTKFPGFIQFCQQNSTEDTTLLKPFTEQESQELETLELKKSAAELISTAKLTKLEKTRLQELNNKFFAAKQLSHLFPGKLPQLKPIFKLTQWPAELGKFVERFDLRRSLHLSEKGPNLTEKHKTWLHWRSTRNKKIYQLFQAKIDASASITHPPKDKTKILDKIASFASFHP